MRIGIIGNGAIGRYVRNKALEGGHVVRSILLRQERIDAGMNEIEGISCVGAVDDLPRDIELVIDCGGHQALRAHGANVLRNGVNLATVSIGALADAELFESLQQAASTGGARLHLASGSVGALDCLRAARVGSLQSVTYIGRKPPQGWKGSPAETRLDLDNLSAGAATHFDGPARTAAIEYPRNANVAAAVALAGIGFDDTQVKLVADPNINENIHEVKAAGEFGSFSFEIRAHALPDNPRSSALAAMSVISVLERESQHVTF